MSEFIQPTSKAHLPHRPILESFDSAEECSLTHWVAVCRLIDEVEIVDVRSGDELSVEVDQVFEETLLEVQPPTAYQNLASHVV